MTFDDIIASFESHDAQKYEIIDAQNEDVSPTIGLINSTVNTYRNLKDELKAQFLGTFRMR